MNRKPALMLVAVSLVTAACAASTADRRPSANARLEPRSGSQVTGELQFVQTGQAVQVRGRVSGLKPNAEHGFHVHENGDCSAPDATSAGGHFNPGGTPHGRPDAPPSARHAGDLTSLRADGSGTARVDLEMHGVTVAAGPAGLAGRSVVVHRDPDDYRSQPAGNSGARVACGLIRQ
ncbi:MAG TPA: superoxide dismutase family protein [Burkholderiaceae bacterium]|nr:superoxide dismutase family protein [Burkholderiaceae bacterium]